MEWTLDNLKDKRLWIRVGYTFLVFLILYAAWSKLFYVFTLIWVGQTVSWMLTGSVNQQGVAYTRFIIMLFYQYLEYFTYVSSDKPYPLNYLP